jgi:hypothetical protein
MRCGLRRRRDAAGRAHHERLREPGACAGAGKRLEVAGHDRPEICVCRSRRRALVLAELRRDLVRRDDACVRQAPPQLLGDRTLVRVVTVSVQEADGDGVRVDLGQRRELERFKLLVGPDPSAHAVAALERDERLWPVGAGAVKLRTRLPSQVQKVLEAGIRHERRARTFAFEQRVRCDGRAVCEPRDARGAHRARGREHRLFLAGSGQHLRGRDAPVLEQDGVGERPADIDAEDRHSGRL